MSDTELDRSVLDTKDREELHQIAGAMGVNAATRMKKADLIDAILGAVDGGDASDGGNRPKRVRSRRASEADDPIAELAAEEEEIASAGASDDASDQPRPVSRTASSSAGEGSGEADSASDASQSTATSTNDSKNKPKVRDGNGGGSGTKPRIEPEDERQSYGEGNRRRRRRRGRDRQQDGEQREFQGEPVATEGLLDLRDEGYGFLRATSYLPGPKDVYVSASQVRRFALRKGDFLKGFARPQASNEKYPALLRVDQVNDLPTEAARERPKFEDLTPLFPDSRLALELEDDPANITGRIVDLVSPIGKGQRGLVVSPPKAGKTTILKQIVYSVERNNPEVHLMVLLVDERPEEVTDMRRHVKNGEVVASTFDRPSDEHTQVAELTIERAKRLVEMGRDVVIILDGITRLARAYNLSAPASGRILSGGVDSTALYPPKRFFGAARNIEEGGSLTIVATALIETGSRMDEVIFEEFKGTGNMELRLDRRLSERRIYPSIDVEASSTRHEELLFDRNQLQQVWKLRRVLNALEDGKGLELLIDKIRTTKSNDEFLSEIAKAPTPGS
ncbi:MAG TPA: transcription termination factor Rho [Acidimicrobiia bacterium]|jgi:transcription termination factor Rho|nr:transcription termination factor Rho [Acidimicrobiia bacterium]